MLRSRIPPALATLAFGVSLAQADVHWPSRVRPVVEFLLAQQTEKGCIPDAPEGLRANEDGRMSRALLAVGHAYRLMSRVRYRNAFRDGVKWLGASMETNDRPWVGTWRYAYAAKPPHVALATSPCDGMQDARGVSSTSALFLYLLALYTHYTNDTVPSKALRPHTRAALEFLLERNRGENELFCRGWHQAKGASKWELCRKQIAVDQADVYLGLRAGYWLLGQERYWRAAQRLAERVPRFLFDRKKRAFGLELDEKGNLVPPDETPESYFTQGYLAWVFGPNRETESAMKWLRVRLARDGSFRRRRTDLAYTLPTAGFCLGAARLGLYTVQVRATRKWLREIAMTPKGGIREVARAKSPLRNDLAGHVVAAWLSCHPYPFRRVRAPDER
jgi:hypothetical protein